MKKYFKLAFFCVSFFGNSSKNIAKQRGINKLIINNIFIFTAALVFASISSCRSSSEESISETFRVYGNCGMCEKSIEGSLDGVDGISHADWNRKNDNMSVTFDASIISLTEIKQKIAAAGYDSETERAPDAVYAKLPSCCQYDRPE